MLDLDASMMVRWTDCVTASTFPRSWPASQLQILPQTIFKGHTITSPFSHMKEELTSKLSSKQEGLSQVRYRWKCLWDIWTGLIPPPCCISNRDVIFLSQFPIFPFLRSVLHISGIQFSTFVCVCCCFLQPSRKFVKSFVWSLTIHNLACYLH